MEIQEFKNYKKIIDDKYPYCDCYSLNGDEVFYIEPNFYSQLKYYETSRPDDYKKIIEELINNVKRNKKVIFTADFEKPVVYLDDFIYQEIEDITDKLQIFSGFKSFGSEYGD